MCQQHIQPLTPCTRAPGALQEIPSNPSPPGRAGSCQGCSPSSLLSSTRMISLSRGAGVWLTALCTERRITDSASFTKMKMMEIWGRSFPYFSSLHLQHQGQRETRGQQRSQGSASSQAQGKSTGQTQGCHRPAVHGQGFPLPANPSFSHCCWEEKTAEQSIPRLREHILTCVCGQISKSGLQNTANASNSSRETPQPHSVPRFTGAQK